MLNRYNNFFDNVSRGAVNDIDPVGQKDRLVDIMGKVLILGVTETNINLLCELTDKDTLDALRLQNDQPSPGIERLFAFLNRKNEEPVPTQKSSSDTNTGSEGGGNLHSFRQEDRLKKLNAMLHKRNNDDNPGE